MISTDLLCVKVYFDNLTNHHFVVGFGQSFGEDWINAVSERQGPRPRKGKKQVVPFTTALVSARA